MQYIRDNNWDRRKGLAVLTNAVNDKYFNPLLGQVPNNEINSARNTIRVFGDPRLSRGIVNKLG